MPDIKNPQGGNVSHELTETVADVIKRYTRQDSKFGLIINSKGKTKKPKPNKKLSEIYKPGVSLQLYESMYYCIDYFYLIIILLFSRHYIYMHN